MVQILRAHPTCMPVVHHHAQCDTCKVLSRVAHRHAQQPSMDKRHSVHAFRVAQRRLKSRRKRHQVRHMTRGFCPAHHGLGTMHHRTHKCPCDGFCTCRMCGNGGPASTKSHTRGMWCRAVGPGQRLDKWLDVGAHCPCKTPNRHCKTLQRLPGCGHLVGCLRVDIREELGRDKTCIHGVHGLSPLRACLEGESSTGFGACARPARDTSFHGQLFAFPVVSYGRVHQSGTRSRKNMRPATLHTTLCKQRRKSRRKTRDGLGRHGCWLVPRHNHGRECQSAQHHNGRHNECVGASHA